MNDIKSPIQSEIANLEEVTNSHIEHNQKEARKLETQRPPDPPKEKVMTPETFAAYKELAEAIARRLRERAAAWKEGPRGS